MNNESISFLRYLKVAQDSDAFFESDQFIPFFQIKLSTSVSNKPLDKNFYTAGNTNNPEDFSLPDSSFSTMPKKLIRINAFNSDKSDQINIYDFKEEEIFEEEIEDIFVNEEAKKLLAFMKNKPKQKSRSNNSDLVLSDSEFTEFVFEVKPRNFNEKNISFEYEENETVIPNDNSNNSSLKKSNINKVQNTTQIFNNKEIHVDTKNQTIEYKSGDINYDIRNQSFPTNIDFTNNYNNTNIVNDIKTEIVQEVNSSISKLENTFINQSITRNEITKVENNIIKVIEEKMVERDSKLLEKIEEKTKKDLKSFSRDFLNS